MTKNKGLCLPISGFSVSKEKKKQMMSLQNGDTRGGPLLLTPLEPGDLPFVILQIADSISSPLISISRSVFCLSEILALIEPKKKFCSGIEVSSF